MGAAPHGTILVGLKGGAGRLERVGTLTRAGMASSGNSAVSARMRRRHVALVVDSARGVAIGGPSVGVLLAGDDGANSRDVPARGRLVEAVHGRPDTRGLQRAHHRVQAVAGCRSPGGCGGPLRPSLRLPLAFSSPGRPSDSHRAPCNR